MTLKINVWIQLWLNYHSEKLEKIGEKLAQIVDKQTASGSSLLKPLPNGKFQEKKFKKASHHQNIHELKGKIFYTYHYYHSSLLTLSMSDSPPPPPPTLSPWTICIGSHMISSAIWDKLARISFSNANQLARACRASEIWRLSKKLWVLIYLKLHGENHDYE